MGGILSGWSGSGIGVLFASELKTVASETTHTFPYRCIAEQAIQSAASGKLNKSFERLDKMGAVVECGLGNQADSVRPR